MNVLEKKMVWLDTDIGTDIDDALTLSYLLSRDDIDLVGISTVSGEPVERAMLAAAICRDFTREHLRVFAGADQGLLCGARQPKCQQFEAVDASRVAKLEDQVARTGAAVEAMYRAALRWPGQVHLLAIGPQTNLAILVRTHPDVVDLLGSVTVMAGRYYGPAYHEWNIWCDPHAAAIVYQSFKQVRSVGLDVTVRTTRPAGQIKKVWEPAGPTVAKAIDLFTQERDKITLHDPLAAASLVDQNILTFEAGTVSVETIGSLTEAVTVFRSAADGPHEVAKEIDLNRFAKHYEQSLAGARTA